MPASTLLVLATIENSHALELSKSMTCRVNPATISLNRPGQMGSVYKAEYFALGVLTGESIGARPTDDVLPETHFLSRRNAGIGASRTKLALTRRDRSVLHSLESRHHHKEMMEERTGASLDLGAGLGLGSGLGLGAGVGLGAGLGLGAGVGVSAGLGLGGSGGAGAAYGSGGSAGSAGAYGSGGTLGSAGAYTSGGASGSAGGYSSGGMSGSAGGYNSGGISGSAGGYSSAGASGSAGGYGSAGTGGYNSAGTSGSTLGLNSGGSAGSSGGYNSGGTSGSSGGYNSGGTSGSSGGYNSAGTSGSTGGYNSAGTSGSNGGYSGGGLNRGGGLTSGGGGLTSGGGGLSPGGGGMSSGGFNTGTFSSGSSSSSKESQSSNYSYASSSSMNYQTMMGSCTGLVKKISDCQNSFVGAGGNGGSVQVNYDTSIQAVQALATEIQTVLANFHTCNECSGNQIHSFRDNFSQIFSQLQQLFSTCRSSFPNQWTALMKTGLFNVDQEFSNFFNGCEQKGLRIKVFIPSELGSMFNQCGLEKAYSTMLKCGIQ
ncbi:hypothetical protein PGTUg99_019048 [Puccinia graminis f. sp. tritici]|uniref:Uncharacterized protein n=1 Tax=Puccinia graminis f. sp. tritici TaxID=56615 RepID=A0A5B0NGX4_PUCGR|nr:hypothetical protein PGTUg99_019048 [Puccinia graminis f. sp. tritici]